MPTTHKGFHTETRYRVSLCLVAQPLFVLRQVSPPKKMSCIHELSWWPTATISYCMVQQNCRSELKSNNLMQLLTVPEDPVIQGRQNTKTAFSDSDRRQRCNDYIGNNICEIRRFGDAPIRQHMWDKKIWWCTHQILDSFPGTWMIFAQEKMDLVSYLSPYTDLFLYT